MELDKVIEDLRSLPIKRKKRVWERFMRKYGCDVICEIGVCRGHNFREMIRHGPKLAVAIDIWKDDGTPSRNDKAYRQEELDQQYEDFKREMIDKPFVKIYRDYSFNVAGEFLDNYFDFIYIDADHTHEGCLRDILCWYPKVRRGGYLLGDDYRKAVVRPTNTRFGVIEAVNEFVKLNNLTFFELPRYGWGIIRP